MSKQPPLDVLLALTKRLQKETNNAKRQKIIKAINPFLSNATLINEIKTKECKQIEICEDCINLLCDKDEIVHFFAKSILTICINNIFSVLLSYILKNYGRVLPPKWIIVENGSENDNDEIYCKLRAMCSLLIAAFECHNKLETKEEKDKRQIEVFLFGSLFKQSSFSLVKIAQSGKSKLNGINLLNEMNEENIFSQIPFALPSIRVQMVLIDFWTKVASYGKFGQACISQSQSFRTLYLIRWLSHMPHELYDNNKYKLKINQLLNLITVKWSLIEINEKSETVLSLQSVIAFLGGSPICHNHKNGINEYVSPLLHKIFERVDGFFVDKIMGYFENVIQAIDDKQFLLILSRMFEWPMTSSISRWVLSILQLLAKRFRFELLNEVAIKHGNILSKQLKDNIELCHGALDILRWLLLGIRPPRSPQAFHNICDNLLPGLILLTSMGVSNNMELANLVEFIATMVFIWPGFPDIYNPILSFIYSNNLKPLMPNDGQLRKVLQSSMWVTMDRSKMGPNKNKNEDYNYEAYKYPNKHGGYDYGGSSWSSSQGLSQSSGALSSYYYSPSYAKSLNEPRSVSTDKAGLTNLGATCYMNSFMQALYLSDDFRQKLLKMKLEFAANDNNKMNEMNDGNEEKEKENKLMMISYSLTNAKMNEKEWSEKSLRVEEMQKIFAKLNWTKRKAVYTREFLNKCGPPWVASRQQDSSEFGKFILDNVWETLQQCKKNENYIDSSSNNIVNQLKIDPYFGGLFGNNIKCCKCNRVSTRYESFTELSLSFKDEKLKNENAQNEHRFKTQSMIDHYFENEILENENAYQCNHCCEKVKAEKSVSVIHAPKHLIVCFKRFSWNIQSGKRIKISDSVDCPLIVNLNKSNMFDECKENEQLNEIKYILYAAVIHSGKSAEYGHYYTIGRHSRSALDEYINGNGENGKWFTFNDSSVTNCSYSQLQSTGQFMATDVPYMLFYRRIDADINDSVNDSKEKKMQTEKEKDNDKDTANETNDDTMESEKTKQMWQDDIDHDNKDFEKQNESSE